MKKICMLFFVLLSSSLLFAQTSVVPVSEMVKLYKGHSYKSACATLEKYGFKYQGYEDVGRGYSRRTFSKNCTLESVLLKITKMGSNNAGVVVGCDYDNYNDVMSNIFEEVYNQANTSILQKQITALGYKKGYSANNGQFYVKDKNSPVLLLVDGDRFGVKYKKLSIWSYAGYDEKYGEKKAANAKAVDLGLSVLWSDRNMGATEIADYGKLYTSPFNYWHAGQAEYSGNKDDIARKEWGSNWRIPSKAEFVELCNNCKKSIITLSNGVVGMKFVGPNGNSIVLPLSGLEYSDSHQKKNAGETGCYWTSSFNNNMIVLSIMRDGKTMTEVSPTTKSLLSIRPVMNGNNNTNTTNSNTVGNKSVYIFDKQGKLTTVEKWDSKNNGNVVGVALITDKIRVLISLHNIGGKETFVWGPDGMVEGVPRSTSNSNSVAGNVLSDYDGKNNTMILMRALSPGTNTALYKASNYIFPNGEKGYLPALGEIIEVFRNIESVNAALLKAGGEIIDNDWYWASSLHVQKYRAWSIAGYSLECFANLRNESSPLAAQYGAAYMYVRPFGSIGQ